MAHVYSDMGYDGCSCLMEIPELDESLTEDEIQDELIEREFALDSLGEFVTSL